MIRRPPRSTLDRSSAASDVYKRQVQMLCYGTLAGGFLTDAWLGKPDPGFEFENRSLIKYRLIIDEFGTWDTFQELLRPLQSLSLIHISETTRPY